MPETPIAPRAVTPRPEASAAVAEPSPNPRQNPPRVALPERIRAAILAHATAARPNEACGLILAAAAASAADLAATDAPADAGPPAGTDAPAAAGADGAHDSGLRFVPVRNAAPSPHGFEIEPTDLLAILVDADARNETIWAIVHSHPATAARPSPRDIAESHYPDAIHLIVSLAPDRAEAGTGEPELRAWRIADGRAIEISFGS